MNEIVCLILVLVIIIAACIILDRKRGGKFIMEIFYPSKKTEDKKPFTEFKYFPENCRNCGNNVSTIRCEYCGTFAGEIKLILNVPKNGIVKKFTPRQNMLMMIGVVGVSAMLGLYVYRRCGKKIIE